MKKLYPSLLLTIVLYVLAINHPVEASIIQPPSEESIQQLLSGADETQFSLSEKHYSWEDALEKLSPYMKQEFAINFMKEHLFLEEEGYIFYGTDFSIYFIPQFSFNDKTTIVVNPDLQSIYIYEKFIGTGPVVFEEQYEMVTLVPEETKWKISNISFLKELPEEVKSGISLDEFSTSVENNDKVGAVNKNQQIVEPLSFKNETSTISFNPFYEIIGVVPYISIFRHSKLVNQLQLQDSGDQVDDTLLTLSTIIWEK
jgi:hypothetical protein